MKGIASRFFAGQLSVGNASSGHTFQRLDEAHSVGCLTIVVAKHLLVQISEQMEWFDTNVSALDATLRQASESFKPVGVNPSVDVTLRVVDEAMNKLEVQAFVASPCVSEYFRSFRDVIVDFLLESVALPIRRDA